ncbi:MAG: hypothetical protein WA964_11500 [Ilumatobacter sp.]|uniref:hypothetical protein n=1 Tax=Ilumatobacter sp. TaxID=1967498 RepID=UPI003C7270E2
MQTGWFQSVPPNGRVARPTETGADNDNPLGLAAPNLSDDMRARARARNAFLEQQAAESGPDVAARWWAKR